MKGCFRLSQSVEAIAQKFMRLAGEACSRAAGIDQVAVAVIAEEQGADAVSTGRERGEPAHDEFLLQNAFRFEPDV